MQFLISHLRLYRKQKWHQVAPSAMYLLIQTWFFQIQEQPWNSNSAHWKTLHTFNFNWKFQLLEYWGPLEALEKVYKITAPVWMDFKNSFAWLTGVQKLIFYHNKFFGSSYFLTFFQIWWIKKWPDPKKFVLIKNLYFHARQPCKGIFEIHSHRCCNFINFFQSF